jgi:hypothetical protein
MNGSYYIIETDSLGKHHRRQLTGGGGASERHRAGSRAAELSMPREALSRGGRPPLGGRARPSDYSTLASTAMHTACAACGLRRREIG